MISIKKVSELEKMLCSYNFLAQNLLMMMTFCRVCVSNWWASLHDFCPLEGCSPAGQGRNRPPILPFSEKTALSSWCRDLGSCFEAQQSVDGVRALPTVPWDLRTSLDMGARAASEGFRGRAGLSGESKRAHTFSPASGKSPTERLLQATRLQA